MKRVILLISLLALPVSMTGCAVSGYWKDRGRDATDIFTATVGVGVGAKARVSAVQAGLLWQVDDAGLRNGEAFINRDDPFIPWHHLEDGTINLLILGWEASNTSFVIERRDKHFQTLNLIVPFGVVEPETCQLTPHYYTQIEAIAGLGPSIRLGFNPGELIDFLLGWAEIDIFDDDLEAWYPLVERWNPDLKPPE